MSKNITQFLESFYLSEQPPVRIPVEKGELGLDIDDSLDKYKNKVEKDGWEKVSQRINALVIFNKNEHPDIATKWRKKREELSKWIESKRKENPDFGK